MAGKENEIHSHVLSLHGYVCFLQWKNVKGTSNRGKEEKGKQGSGRRTHMWKWTWDKRIPWQTKMKDGVCAKLINV